MDPPVMLTDELSVCQPPPPPHSHRRLPSQKRPSISAPKKLLLPPPTPLSSPKIPPPTPQFPSQSTALGAHVVPPGYCPGSDRRGGGVGGVTLGARRAERRLRI
ncbi:hypothetical protein PVAP13_2KG520005 [Panicum virgatum]|uniref:Uncharacterized protein n=1 Tax=Panicum virgatum TaxID=38727 RepID=A0A8T0WKN3_PANVG|nr:hypothetical protein PVAP13_2KG520005 [Panicum virgatum]